MRFHNKERQTVPAVSFKVRRNNDWQELTTAELFSGKTVVVFSLPGAFTPTCSSAHVPRYNELAPVFFKHGVDTIICVSVNDAFVMDEWQRDQGADHLVFLPDGSGEFTCAMDMLVNKDDLGFGMRSRRYSMLVKDGVIEKMFIEPDKPGDPYEVSDADTMLRFINPDAVLPADVAVVTRPGCPYCIHAKHLLRQGGIEFEEITVGKDISRRGVRALCGVDTVPQIFVNGEYLGDAEALARWRIERLAA